MVVMNIKRKLREYTPKTVFGKKNKFIFEVGVKIIIFQLMVKLPENFICGIHLNENCLIWGFMVNFSENGAVVGPGFIFFIVPASET